MTPYRTLMSTKGSLDVMPIYADRGGVGIPSPRSFREFRTALCVHDVSDLQALFVCVRLRPWWLGLVRPLLVESKRKAAQPPSGALNPQLSTKMAPDT